MTIEYVDHLPDDWFVFEVMRKSARKWDWVAILVDTDPDDELRIRVAARAIFVSPGSTETEMPLGAPLKAWQPRGIEAPE